MKKKLLLLPICFLTACSGSGVSSHIESSESTTAFYIVTFKYNLKENDTNYMNFVVSEGQVLNEPKAPLAEDKVFEGWYKEATCENKYLRWGLEINSDLTLYANWTDYADLDIKTQIANFQEQLKSLGKDANKVVCNTDGYTYYPFMEQGGNYKDRYVYTRYKDITEKEYYSIDASEKATLYAKQQFYYDEKNFYNVYVNYEDSTQNKTKSSTFNKDKIESFISIDFYNLFGAVENTIVSCINAGTYTEETFEYSFTGNYTKLNKNLETYTYSETVYVADYNDYYGDYVTEECAYSYGLIFEDGRIKAANVSVQAYIAIGQEVYEYDEETSVYDFYYNEGNYAEFTGQYLA